MPRRTGGKDAECKRLAAEDRRRQIRRRRVVAFDRLQHVVDVMLADRRNAWDLTSDGSYTRSIPPADADANSPAVLGSFETLMRHAQGKA